MEKNNRKKNFRKKYFETKIYSILLYIQNFDNIFFRIFIFYKNIGPISSRHYWDWEEVKLKHELAKKGGNAQRKWRKTALLREALLRSCTVVCLKFASRCRGLPQTHVSGATSESKYITPNETTVLEPSTCPYLGIRS